MAEAQGKRSSGINLWFVGLLTLVVCISYGIGINRLSYYGDDWIYIYNYHIAGPESFTLFTQWDRPYSAWIYVLTTGIFKESALAYHLFVLFLRWLSGLLFYRILTGAFGKRKAASAAALLFVTYPGFQQQPVAVEFVMHFTSLVLVLLSFRLMQIAFSESHRKMILPFIISLATGVLSIFTCEYFIGLELARPLFLYCTEKQNRINKRDTVSRKKMLLFLAPYILAAVFYFVWRIFIFSFTTYEPKLLIALKENPVNGIKILTEKVLRDIFTVTASSYRMVFSRPSLIPTALSISILLIITAAAFIFLWNLVKRSNNSGNKEMLVIGCMLMLLSGLPYWGTLLDVSVDFPWDRSTLSFSPAAAMIITAVLEAALQPAFFCGAAALITAFSSLFQIQNTQEYIYESEKMNDYFWQLAWRAPDLETGTILVSEEIPLDRTSDNDLTPIINWQYAPENKGLHYDYKLFDLHLREGVYYADPLTNNPVDHTYRTHTFSSSTDKTLGIFYKKNGCLQIIDSFSADYPDLPASLIRLSSLSDRDLIITNTEHRGQPPAAIGAEPDHDYCYYFQKIELSRQRGETETAYSLASEILQSDLHPVYAPDLAPVILAFLDAGDIDSAESLISGTTISSKDYEYLCRFWMDGQKSSEISPELENFYKYHNCYQ